MHESFLAQPAFVMVLALAIDWQFGEPRRWHPLVGFGNIATKLERARWFGNGRWAGGMSWALLVAPILIAAWLISDIVIFQIAGLYLAIGHKSLHEHAMQVFVPLENGDIEGARHKVSYVVSRDTEHLDANGVSKATIESVLENGSDSTIAALFWFALAGLPGVIGYRLINTLDAMWGYRTTRFQDFGFCAARADDIANWPAARLTSIAYALVGNFDNAITCWRTQAANYSSPNAGPVMASGAGALGVCLGGDYTHNGHTEQRPLLGSGAQATAADIVRALSLLVRAVVAVVLLLCVLTWVI
ncbi:MAG: adenosylcobinamide-phosphate synthase CbiB [Pseudomonadota bacterium]